MPSEPEKAKDGAAAAPLAASAIVLSLIYIAAAVVGHSDSDLIRPDTQVSLEKVSLPNGWIFAPLLGAKLPIFWFYVAAPVIVLVLHAELLRHTPADGNRRDLALRFAGNSLAPLTLFLLLWKFAPYGNARPPDFSDVSLALFLSAFHAGALFCDAALFLYALLARTDSAARQSARSDRLRRVRVALVALRQAGLLWLVAFCIATAIKFSFRHSSEVDDGMLAIGLACIIGIAVWVSLVLVQHVRISEDMRIRFHRTHAARGVATMFTYAFLLTILIVGASLPGFGRPLHLDGARLAAAEPNEAVVAAMIGAAYGHGADPTGPIRARHHAWDYFGRGLDYAGWRFPAASFDRAVMPKINLTKAKLNGATLVGTNLSQASLIGTNLQGAVLVEADLWEVRLDGATDLRQADLRRADLSQARRSATATAGTQPQNTGPMLLAQRPESTRPPGQPSAQPPAGTGPATEPSKTEVPAPSRRDVCGRASGGPKLDRVLLGGASLTEADLSNASLHRADLVDVKPLIKTNLSMADLRDAKLGVADPGPGKAGVIFKEQVNLKGACLCGADLRGADLTGAIVDENTTFRAANLFKAKLPPVLQGVNFEGANIKDAEFTGDTPDLRRAILDRAVQMDGEAFAKNNPPCKIGNEAAQGAAQSR